VALSARLGGSLARLSGSQFWPRDGVSRAEGHSGSLNFGPERLLKIPPGQMAGGGNRNSGKGSPRAGLTGRVGGDLDPQVAGLGGHVRPLLDAGEVGGGFHL